MIFGFSCRVGHCPHPIERPRKVWARAGTFAGALHSSKREYECRSDLVRRDAFLPTAPRCSELWRHADSTHSRVQKSRPSARARCAAVGGGGRRMEEIKVVLTIIDIRRRSRHLTSSLFTLTYSFQFKKPRVIGPGSRLRHRGIVCCPTLRDSREVRRVPRRHRASQNRSIL